VIWTHGHTMGAPRALNGFSPGHMDCRSRDGRRRGEGTGTPGRGQVPAVSGFPAKVQVPPTTSKCDRVRRHSATQDCDLRLQSRQARETAFPWPPACSSPCSCSSSGSSSCSRLWPRRVAQWLPLIRARGAVDEVAVEGAFGPKFEPELEPVLGPELGKYLDQYLDQYLGQYSFGPVFIWVSI
jgi:hypothetical protein